jgi:hypothetical protein
MKTKALSHLQTHSQAIFNEMIEANGSLLLCIIVIGFSLCCVVASEKEREKLDYSLSLGRVLWQYSRRT